MSVSYGENATRRQTCMTSPVDIRLPVDMYVNVARQQQSAHDFIARLSNVHHRYVVLCSP